MKVLAWNCRGLARSPTIRALRALIRSHRPDLIFLSETKTPSSHFRSSLIGLGFFAWLEVPPVGLQGGLFLSWKGGVDIEPVRLDKNNISCIVYSDPQYSPWLFSGVYAPPNGQRRSEFWHCLESLGNSFGGAWLLLGDFNSILSASEKSGGRVFGSSSHNDFVDFVNYNALVDLGFVGNKFTWSNCRIGRANIRERLDRGLANQSWVHLFPNCLINHFPATQSDHCPLLISTTGSYRNLPKPFRFEAFWTRDNSSHAVVAEAWLGEVEGSPAFSLSRKWKNTKGALKFWNQHHFGHIQQKIKSLMADISVIQSSPHSSANAAREQVLQEALQEQLLREEILWKQKSRELWLTCTDLNTKFFHASTVSRRRYNSVSRLKTVDGIIIEGRTNIGNYLVQHFSSQFTTTNPVLDSSLSELVGRVVTEEENGRLCVIPDELEIFSVISDLGLNKAPGPDGRSIHDNTILAHELFHTMKQKKGNGGLMALKLDMAKAFDSMEWDFLLKILNLLGFHPTWVQWIHQCITTSSFSILLDGAPFGNFSPSRGLRQGDPLSPFLFIMGSEILSRLIEREENLGLLHGIKMVRMCPPISHLLFADDVIIFSKANVSEAQVILNCLNTYSAWSGQHINLAKSAVLFSKNCSLSRKSSINGILNLAQIPAQGKYLGIPLFLHSKKQDSFIDLKDRIFAKFSGWKARLLSQAARTTLIKSVANAIPTYVMSLFLLPKSLCSAINSI
ncbi:uncharacterized protein LOC132170396 [Corylus avellana]|uniref:uncharacterized protein LOC132170396 n=1 Tax=Corylus avellana TaxID=13451 RepID=UPI00286D1CA3|nr:uncharacterized protein LOC132170396 [Corylus avellana]